MTAAQAGASAPPPPPGGGVVIRARRVPVAALLALVVVAATGVALVLGFRRFVLNEARDRATAQLIPYGQSLGTAVARRTALLQSFRAYLTVHTLAVGEDLPLQRFTTGLRATTPGVRSLQLIRDGRIVSIAPLAGNEAALGLDLRTHPSQLIRDDLVRTERTDSVILTGPFTLVQGGTGIVVRQRIPQTGTRPVELASVVLDLPPILVESGILEVHGLDVRLYEDAGIPLAGAPFEEAADPVSVVVPVPGHRWILEAVPKGGWDAAIGVRLWLFTSTLGITGLLLVVVVALTAGRQATLEQAVAERTRSLNTAVDELHAMAAERERTELQLRQLQRLDSLGRLAGGIAHDFNNLLTVILASLGVAREAVPADGQVAEDIGTAERAGRRASELTRKLLVFARRQTVAPQVLDLNDTIADLHPILHRLLGERIQVQDELGPGLWPVFIEPGQLDQVITNLAVNARDAMPHGGTLTLRTRNVEGTGGEGPMSPSKGDYIRLEVSDTGTGMSEEILHQVFEPFFTTKELGKGTGLGLATVYGIVRQAGGSVSIASTVGTGTTVTILLPRAAEGHHQTPVPVGGGPAGDKLSGNVLLVEDDPAVRQIVVRMLADLGLRVTAAEEGEAGLSCLAADLRLDLLVTDIVTPGLGGRALAERVLARDPRTRVLFISGYVAEERLEGMLGRPGIGFLEKPFTRQELRSMLLRLVQEAPWDA